MVFKDLLPDEERVMKNLPPKAEDVNFVVKNYPELYNSWQSFDPNFKNLLRNRVNQVEQEYKRKKEKQDLPTQITEFAKDSVNGWNGLTKDLKKDLLDIQKSTGEFIPATNTDKYVHCSINCRANARGAEGRKASEIFSNVKEFADIFDQPNRKEFTNIFSEGPIFNPDRFGIDPRKFDIPFNRKKQQEWIKWGEKFEKKWSEIDGAGDQDQVANNYGRNSNVPLDACDDICAEKFPFDRRINRKKYWGY